MGNNLTPLIPLSFKGEGKYKKRGFAPLKHPIIKDLLPPQIPVYIGGGDLKITSKSPIKNPKI